MNVRKTLRGSGFSLVEVVLALGVVSFAIIAILGVIPTGLGTSHSAQDQTRSSQIAEDILSSLASQSQDKWPKLVIKQNSPPFSFDIDLSTSHQYDTMAADNDGRLVALASVNDAMKYPYQVLVQVEINPAGFDNGYASKVTVRVISPPSANPATTTPSPTHSVRDTVRIISKY